MSHCFWVVLLAAVVVANSQIAVALEPGENCGPLRLTGLSDNAVEVKNFDQRPVTALVFLSSRCDVTARVIESVTELYRKRRLGNVLFVGIFSNPAESADEVRNFAQRSGLIFPVYRDPTGEVAKQLGARVTPELFLVDRGGRLVFHGGLQDDVARNAYETAVTSLLRKQPVAVTTHGAEGTPLAQPGEPREVNDPYGTISFSAEFVFERIPQAPAHHCSTICEAANRDLLCLWYGGSYESADDQTLFLARKAPDEKNWSAPQPLIQNTAQPPGNGVIFRDATNRVWIVWCRMEGSRPMRRGSGWDRCRLFYRTSTDHGRSWSEDQQMLDETLWCVPRNPPITLADGSLLLPVEGLLDDVEGSHFLSLAKSARSWQRAGFTSGGSQPALAERADGSLLAMMRHARNITQIESHDRGKTWSDAVPTALKNPDSGITMTKLANGHLLLVYNDSQTKRTPLSIVRSTDEGRTWEEPRQLESNPGEYSYPCIIQSADGKIHVSYTFRRYAIKHVEFNEDWLVHFERPD